MVVKLIGDVFDIVRVQTGFKTLDDAFGNNRGDIGIPLTTVELFGPTGCGKTTTAWFLAQQTAKHMSGMFSMLNIEQFDPKHFINSMDFYQYDGEVHLATGGSDEDRMDAAMSILRQKHPIAYVLDSIGAISPISEKEGKSGEANMGRRAKLTAVHIRKVCHYILDSGGVLAIFINHVHPNLGFVGTDTPGGKTLKYMSAIRVKIKKNKVYPDGSYTIDGSVVKNRFGFERRVFYLWVLGGQGVHPGMSAVNDCIQLGLLTKPKGARAYEWADTHEKIPTLASLVSSASNADSSVFDPFFSALSTTSAVAEMKENAVEDE